MTEIPSKPKKWLYAIKTYKMTEIPIEHKKIKIKGKKTFRICKMTVMPLKPKKLPKTPKT